MLDYCRRSANPVGRLVLRVAGYDDAALDAQSDAVCTALQLDELLAGRRDRLAQGRLYVPELVAAGRRAPGRSRSGPPISNGRSRTTLTGRPV